MKATLTNTLPAELADELPPYLQAHHAGLEPAMELLRLYLYAPMGGTISDVQCSADSMTEATHKRSAGVLPGRVPHARRHLRGHLHRDRSARGRRQGARRARHAYRAGCAQGHAGPRGLAEHHKPQHENGAEPRVPPRLRSPVCQDGRSCLHPLRPRAGANPGPGRNVALLGGLARHDHLLEHARSLAEVARQHHGGALPALGELVHHLGPLRKHEQLVGLVRCPRRSPG